MSHLPSSSGISQRDEILEDLEILSKIVADLTSLQFSRRLRGIEEKLKILTSQISQLNPSELDPIANVLKENKVRAKVWTDGSCYNQGQNEPRAAFGVYWGEGHPNNHGELITADKHDSTLAELFAAHYAIKQALDQNFFAVKLYSDSVFVKEVIKRPSDFLRSRHKNFRDLVSKISVMVKKIPVSLEHVKSGKPGNKEADELARKATMPAMTKTQKRNKLRREAQKRLDYIRLTSLGSQNSLRSFWSPRLEKLRRVTKKLPERL